MNQFVNLVVSGAITGTLYSLIATGIVLSYTASGIFNFSYGAIAYVTALLYLQLHTGLGWPVGLAAAVCLLVFCPLLGLLLNGAVFRPLANSGPAPKVMATVGLLVALPAAARWLIELGIDHVSERLVSPANVYSPAGLGPVPTRRWLVHGRLQIDSNQLIVAGVAAAAAGGLWVLMRRTSLGLRMRAVVDRNQLAQLRGVDERSTSTWAWVFGTMLAGLAGVAGAPLIGALDVNTYTTMVFVSAAAAVVGGLRSLPLAFAGGVLLGVTQNLFNTYAGDLDLLDDVQGLSSAVPFAVLLVGLVFLTRDRSRVSGSAAAATPPIDPNSDLPTWRRRAPWAIAGLLLVVYAVFLANAVWAGIVVQGLALSLVFMSWTVIIGIGGMVSLAQSALATTAGLVAGLVLAKSDLPFLGAIVLGTGAAVVMGVVVALPAIRLGGLPLALATLALGLMGDLLIFKTGFFNNDQLGWTVDRPKLGPLDLSDDPTMAVCLLVVVMLAAGIVELLKRSPTGRAIYAVRASEVASSTSGHSVVRVKLTVFAVSAAFAGIGGVILASYNESISGSSYPTQTGLIWLATLVLFGVARPAGAVVGGLVAGATPTFLSGGFHFPSWVPSYLSWDGTTTTYVAPVLFGLGAVQLSRSPDGVMALMAMQRRTMRDRRLGATGASVGDRSDASAAVTIASRPAQAVDGMTPEAAALEAVHVHAGYFDVEVLHDVSLSLGTGRIMVVLGGNGAGKSTMAATLAGTVAATSGEVRLGGHDVTRMAAHRRSRAGLVLAPEGRGIFPGLLVEENLAVWLGDRAQREAVYDRFPRLGDRRDQLAGSLSGGEQQLLTLAPLLVRPPRVLVADEPTLGLAPMIVDQVVELFNELRNAGVSLLLIEEKAHAVLDVADDVALFALGRVVWRGARHDLREEQLAAAYLGDRRVELEL